MNCWQRLGIEETTDARAIRRAYAALLKKTHPEDDPEAFQSLREARDHALMWAEHLQQQADTSPEAEIPTSVEGSPAYQAPAPTPQPQPQPQQETAPTPVDEGPLYEAPPATPPSVVEPVDTAVSRAQAWYDRAAALAADARWRSHADTWQNLLEADALHEFEVRDLLFIPMFELLRDHILEEVDKAIPKDDAIPDSALVHTAAVFGWADRELELAHQFPAEDVDRMMKKSRLHEDFGTQSSDTKTEGGDTNWFLVVILGIFLVRAIARLLEN